ncbi:CHAT domain-containing protein [Mycena capillaripes]|nr:CHAT domain-containing protein [Mycena capillaripes]
MPETEVDTASIDSGDSARQLGSEKCSNTSNAGDIGGNSGGSQGDLFLAPITVDYGSGDRNLDDLDPENPEMLPRIQQFIAQTPSGHTNAFECRQLGTTFRGRYMKSGSLNDLEASVKHFQAALCLTPEEHYDRADTLQELVVALMDRYRRLGGLKDLEAALQMAREAVDLAPIGHHNHAGKLQNLAFPLRHQYRRFGDIKDLEAALLADRAAVDLTPHEHPDRAHRLQSLAISYTDRYQKLQDIKDLEAALHEAQEAVDLTPPEDSDRAYRLQTLGVALVDRYRSLGDLKDLEAALLADREAVDLTPPGHPDLGGRLHTLAVALTDRYRGLEDQKDLEVALHLKQGVLDLTPAGHPDRAERLQSLGVSLTDQYQRLGNMKDLEAALLADKEAVDLTPPGHPGRAGRLHNLAVSLTNRYQSLGELQDLEAALLADREAVDLTPPGHPDRAKHLQSVAESVRDRYQRLGDLKDLETAVQAAQEAVNLTTQKHPDQADHLQTLAISFTDRYQRLGNLEDMEAALQIFRQAVDLTPPEHSDRAHRLQGLAGSLRDRYWRLGDLKELEAAVRANQEAVQLTPTGHPKQAERLQSLAVSFGERYLRLRDFQDLETSLHAFQEAVDLTPPRHPTRASLLQNIAISLTERYEIRGDLNDLEGALHTVQDAVDLTPPEHPERPRRLQQLAVSLTDRYSRLQDLRDLNTALQAAQEAVNLTPPEHPDLAGRLEILAMPFTHRYERLGDPKDFEAAMEAHRQALYLTPLGHPDRTVRLQNLAISLMDRYRELGDPKDLDDIHTHYDESFKLPSLTPETAWEQALSWADFAEEFQPSDCIPAFQTAFAQLPEILWIGNPIPVRHDAIRRLDITGATSSAIRTCIDLSHYHAAVEILEQGLATIFQQMLQLKTDVDVLPPEQAKKLLDLSSQLYSGTLADDLISIVEDRKQLLKDIREQQGFEYFLLPKPYNFLRHASQGGPVIILTSHEDHCDAIIIMNPTSEPVLVALPTVTLELLESQREMLKDLLDRCNIRNRGQSLPSRLTGQRERVSYKLTEECFKEMLNWLWINVVGPVYQLLTSALVATNRCICRTASACKSPTNEFIHSYTTTLGSLIDAYAKKSTITAPKLAVVGVTHTDSSGSNPLKSVDLEVNKIVSIVNEPYVQCLLGKQATVDAVKFHLQDCSWVHLACHGCQDISDPTKSHLQLYEGNLELETILRMPLPNAQFVFLAACQTAMGDAKLVNESFHLGGGFITAGFQSAIGTMWSMRDEDGPNVAESVYSHLFQQGQDPKHTDAAEALQLAIQELKNRKTFEKLNHMPIERTIKKNLGLHAVPVTGTAVILTAVQRERPFVWANEMSTARDG